jgi:hypothetical protein
MIVVAAFVRTSVLMLASGGKFQDCDSPGLFTSCCSDSSGLNSCPKDEEYRQDSQDGQDEARSDVSGRASGCHC